MTEIWWTRRDFWVIGQGTEEFLARHKELKRLWRWVDEDSGVLCFKVTGWVMQEDEIFGIDNRDGYGLWMLTHLPTGLYVPGATASRLRDVKPLAEALYRLSPDTWAEGTPGDGDPLWNALQPLWSKVKEILDPMRRGNE